MMRNIGLMMLIALLLSSTACGVNLPKAKVTLKVVDEEGLPMSGIDTSITFKGMSYKNYKNKSDLSGKYTAGAESDGGVSFSASKPGYYNSHGSFQFTNMEAHKFLPKTYKWLPWNPEVKLVLRKIANPVPMYARDATHSKLEIPAVGKEVGFDLMEYSWMPPYGKGKHADFIFKLEKRFVSQDDFDSTLTITFSNKFDGIQLLKEDRRNGSMFKLPRIAPDAGYQSKLVRYFRRSPGKPIEDSTAKDNNYIFRLRSEMHDGKFVRAMYGKILGDIEFDPRGEKTASVIFIYYLNPDYTRNLEYDRTRNLFGNLPEQERVEQ